MPRPVAAIVAFVSYYNYRRYHKALGYKTPDQFYHQWLNTNATRKEVLSDMS